MTERDRLSEREKEVAALLLQGKGNKQIAAVLHITVRTVEFHLTNIYGKLGVASRTEAALKLAKNQLRESTGDSKGSYLGESTVDMEGAPAENGRKPISRRIRVNRQLYVIGGCFLAVVMVVVLIVLVGPLTRGADYHSDEEIAQQALRSAADNFDKTEMNIANDDPLHIGTVVLNQFLRAFRQRKTHYGIRLSSYEIVELEHVKEAHNQLYYTARVRVVPQDRARFAKILDGVFPYEENADGVFVSLKFTVLRQQDTYKLVDVASE
jgi:DNA-binding CsgD family transcriptional regulator